MDEGKQERKAKWDQPEIEDFSEEQDDGQARQKGWGHHHGGCRPMAIGGWHGMCRPNAVCYPAGFWGCHPRRPCSPRAGFQIFNPYCRPNGFNYGYGCFPRR